mmetsp:Transcript_10030/g.19297  ORF Transcript_10030/g.19297 Transcript_10030/m.19297 type:complete len:218 (+) Transcript_10030:375-1028(+)
MLRPRPQSSPRLRWERQMVVVPPNPKRPRPNRPRHRVKVTLYLPQKTLVEKIKIQARNTLTRKRIRIATIRATVKRSTATRICLMLDPIRKAPEMEISRRELPRRRIVYLPVPRRTKSRWNASRSRPRTFTTAIATMIVLMSGRRSKRRDLMKTIGKKRERNELNGPRLSPLAARSKIGRSKQSDRKKKNRPRSFGLDIPRMLSRKSWSRKRSWCNR